ncbi:DoxX family protein [Streptomyces pathocidini]|uniref:DoxX family protein n=1 Tax=Streptomyces pathocidini TaxID=1650571 RepID=UPI0033C74EBB
MSKELKGRAMRSGTDGKFAAERVAGRIGVAALRIALGAVFIWFGWPKLFAGLSPAESLVVMTTEKLTFGLVTGDVARITVAVLELAVGISLIIGWLPRATVAVLLAHMAGTVAPLVLFPDLTWSAVGVGTMEGQYILKNIVIVAGALVLLGHAPRRGGEQRGEAPQTITEYHSSVWSEREKSYASR